MQDVLRMLQLPDYHFVVQSIASSWNLTDDNALAESLAAYESSGSEADRTKLDGEIENALSYLGSSEIAYFVRKFQGSKPGVSFRQVVDDVATSLGMRVDRKMSTVDQLVDLVTGYATKRFAELSPEEQQKMLVELGVDKKRARDFVKRSAGVFAPALLVEAFNLVIIEGLIKRIIFGTIARFLGRELSRKLFTFLVGRFPWWVAWVGPLAWAGSIGWTAFDLQGPALRKTTPVVLYLGLVALRNAGPPNGELHAPSNE